MKVDINLILSIISGLIVCIPLVIKLVKVAKESIENKNWDKLLSLIIDLMKVAEVSFTTGAARKEFVINELKIQADKLEYPINDADWERISTAIDAMVSMTKVINSK